MIRAVAASAALVVALLVSAPSSRAADECKGLQVCIPVEGPWVAIPAPSGLFAEADWKLVCPQGVVGGVAARASEKAVSVDFPGLLGSPVNPGITTAGSLVFRGTYAGRAHRVTSYQPSIGCIPQKGGGGRTRVSFSPAGAVVPGSSITIRIATLEVLPGRLARASLRCKPGERLLASAHSVGLYTDHPPTAFELSAVHVIRARRGRRILASATRAGLAADVRVEVQVQATCTT
ncbi:MAG: hypothetical protein ABI317_01330 [Gaiellales bacterium]